jgi:hypothetical protein
MSGQAQSLWRNRYISSSPQRPALVARMRHACASAKVSCWEAGRLSRRVSAEARPEATTLREDTLLEPETAPGAQPKRLAHVHSAGAVPLELPEATSGINKRGTE